MTMTKKRKLQEGMTQELSSKIYKLSEEVFKSSYGEEKETQFHPGDGNTATLRKGLEKFFIDMCEFESDKKINELSQEEKIQYFLIFQTRAELYAMNALEQNVPMSLEEFRRYIYP
jgi:hypothetical protein